MKKYLALMLVATAALLFLNAYAYAEPSTDSSPFLGTWHMTQFFSLSASYTKDWFNGVRNDPLSITTSSLQWSHSPQPRWQFETCINPVFGAYDIPKEQYYADTARMLTHNEIDKIGFDEKLVRKLTITCSDGRVSYDFFVKGDKDILFYSAGNGLYIELNRNL